MKVDIFNQLHEATNNLPAHLYAVDTEDLFIWNLLLLNLDNVYFYCSDKSRVVWDRFGSDLGHASGTPFPNSFQNQQQLCSGFPSGQQWTVLPTAAEPGQFSGEINSSIFWQPERPGGEHSCITGTQTDLSASMLDSHNSKKNKLPKSRTGRLTVTLWVHMSWELCGKYQWSGSPELAHDQLSIKLLYLDQSVFYIRLVLRYVTAQSPVAFLSQHFPTQLMLSISDYPCMPFLHIPLSILFSETVWGLTRGSHHI